MGISRGKSHKRTATGAKKVQNRKKRKFELGRQAANTKLGPKRVHEVRTRGGNHKHRALRLDHGNFSWGSEAVTKKTRIADVVYNASSNELVRTKTLVKSAIVQVDAAPFRQWWEARHGVALDQSSAEPLPELDPLLANQLSTGKLYAIIKSRPGQCGRCDGYILEGRELEFYLKRIKTKK